MRIIPRQYYFVRGRHGAGPMRAIKVIEPARDGHVLASDALTGKPVNVESKAFVKQTDKAEIARTTGRKVDMIL